MVLPRMANQLSKHICMEDSTFKTWNNFSNRDKNKAAFYKQIYRYLYFPSEKNRKYHLCNENSQ